MRFFHILPIKILKTLKLNIMTPTFQLLMNAIGKLIISILRFSLALFYSGFKFVNTICIFFINLMQEILNRLP